MEKVNDFDGYLIPKNVKAKFQFLPGIGWIELLVVGAGFAVGILLFLLLSLFTKSLLRIFAIVLFTALAFALINPDPKTGLCLLILLKQYKEYKTKPNKYLYIFGKGRLNGRENVQK